jgi:hypothetical protein
MRSRTCNTVLLLAIVSLSLSSLAWAACPGCGGTAPAPADSSAGERTVQPAPEGYPGCVDTSGAVAYYCDDPRAEVWVTIGTGRGLRPKAKVSFVREGQVVAQGEVITVRTDDAIVKPVAGTAAGAIRIGDALQVDVNGTRADADLALARERRREDLGTLFFAALLTGTIIAAR